MNINDTSSVFRHSLHCLTHPNHSTVLNRTVSSLQIDFLVLLFVFPCVSFRALDYIL